MIAVTLVLRRLGREGAFAAVSYLFRKVWCTVAILIAPQCMDSRLQRRRYLSLRGLGGSGIATVPFGDCLVL